MNSVYTKLASAIFNDIQGGLRGYHQTLNMSLEQLEDDIVDERLIIIKEYAMKGILPKKDLQLSLNCIPVDCESLDRCPCDNINDCEELVAHFQIPQVAIDLGWEALEYVGTTDRQLPFTIYTDLYSIRYHKYRRRAGKYPFVYIDYTPNKNNMNDGFIFNAPLIKTLSVIFIPKDPRQLENYGCCPTEEIENMSFINNEIKRRLTEKKIRWYRQLQAPLLPNDQTPE